MKKITPNGTMIKKLREQLDKGSLQKEMCHDVGISIRKFRDIENTNSTITVAELDRIAKYLGVSPDHIAFAIDTPKLVPSEALMDSIIDDLYKDRVVPRFDKEYARATMDEERLLHDASHSDDLTVQMKVKLAGETSEYAEELVRLLTALTWSNRDWLKKSTPADEIAIARQVRKLLVLLKGNDIWLYYTHHYRYLPERYDLPGPDDPTEFKSRLALLFGPPAEYGEDSLEIDVDNGQPHLLKGWDKKQGGD